MLGFPKFPCEPASTAAQIKNATKEMAAFQEHMEKFWKEHRLHESIGGARRKEEELASSLIFTAFLLWLAYANSCLILSQLPTTKISPLPLNIALR